MADEYDPADPPTFDAADEDSYDPAEYANYDQQDENGAAGDEAADDADGDADEDDDYDPSSVNYGDDSAELNASTEPPPTHTSTPTQAEPPAAKPQQKVAGFLVDESDDEQDGDAPPAHSQVNGNAGAQSGLGAVAVSEAQDVSLRSAPQDTAAPSSTSLNGSTTVPVPASTTSSTVPDSSLQPPAPPQQQHQQGKAVSPAASVQQTPQPQQTSFAPASQPPPQTNGPVVVAPTKRLPHDKVGQLEDRIKDDPKGDTEAWLALIQHYIEKDQYDYARNVYKRFFQVFPTAVCTLCMYFLSLET